MPGRIAFEVAMQGTLTEWITLTGNCVGGLVVLYWLVDTVRNWGGTPELKILKDELQRTNKHIERLIKSLPSADRG